MLLRPPESTEVLGQCNTISLNHRVFLPTYKLKCLHKETFLDNNRLSIENIFCLLLFSYPPQHQRSNRLKAFSLFPVPLGSSRGNKIRRMLDRDVLDACRLQHRCPPVLTKHSQYGPHPLTSNQNTETLQQEIFPLTVFPHIYQLITLWMFVIYETFFTNSHLTLIVYHVKWVNQCLYNLCIWMYHILLHFLWLGGVHRF